MNHTPRLALFQWVAIGSYVQPALQINLTPVLEPPCSSRIPLGEACVAELADGHVYGFAATKDLCSAIPLLSPWIG